MFKKVAFPICLLLNRQNKYCLDFGISTPVSHVWNICRRNTFKLDLECDTRASYPV